MRYNGFAVDKGNCNFLKRQPKAPDLGAFLFSLTNKRKNGKLNLRIIRKFKNGGIGFEKIQYQAAADAVGVFKSQSR